MDLNIQKMTNPPSPVVDDTATRNFDQDKAWPPNIPAQEAEGGNQQLTPTQENSTQGLGEHMQNSNEATQRVHKHMFHQPQNTKPLSDTANNTMHMVFDGELTVKLHTKDVEVGTRIETPDKTKPIWGGLKVLDLLMTWALVLLIFSMMYQWLHHSWILAKSLLRDAATADVSAGLRTTASNVEPSA